MAAPVVQQDLLSRLRMVVDDDDIDPILLSASGGPVSRTQREIRYSTDGARPVLFARLGFNGKGKVCSFESGPALQSPEAQDGFVERARVEAAHSHGSFVVLRPLVSLRPLTGRFDWNDSIRISPCSDGTVIGSGFNWFHRARTPFQVDPHKGPPFPMLLQVRVPKSPNQFLQTNRQFRLLDQYQFLLTLLIADRLGYAHWPSSPMWTQIAREDSIENHLLSSGFSIPENGIQDDFLHSERPTVTPYEDADYYERLWSADAALPIPLTLGSDLALFHALSHDEAKAFLRACYWYAVGVQLHSAPAISTVALATAIECLLPRPPSLSCEKCGKPRGPGPTKLFATHIKRYGQVIPALEKRRDALYAARSALVHGSHADRVDVSFFTHRPSSLEEGLLLQIVCQRSLIGWLRDPERAAAHLGGTE
jgi:hypothetical protein